jgi:hypothetical protein
MFLLEIAIKGKTVYLIFFNAKFIKRNIERIYLILFNARYIISKMCTIFFKNK